LLSTTSAEHASNGAGSCRIWPEGSVESIYRFCQQ
jgi:hypothetical protein